MFFWERDLDANLAGAYRDRDCVRLRTKKIEFELRIHERLRTTLNFRPLNVLCIRPANLSNKGIKLSTSERDDVLSDSNNYCECRWRTVTRYPSAVLPRAYTASLSLK